MILLTKSHEPMLYTFNYDSIFLLQVVLQLSDGVCSRAQASPTHIPLRLSLCTLRNTVEVDEEYSQCT